MKWINIKEKNISFAKNRSNPSVYCNTLHNRKNEELMSDDMPRDG